MLFLKGVLMVLFAHQTLDVIGIKGYVSRPELKSPDTIGWVIFSVFLALYFLGIPFINYVFIGLFGLVLYGFYNFHWKHFFFGSSEKKVKSYNEYFTGTHRIIAESNHRVIPDTFHIVHTFLYMIAFGSLIIDLIF